MRDALQKWIRCVCVLMRKLVKKIIFKLKLGVNQCGCKVPIVQASVMKNMKPEKKKICYDFCRFHKVSLKGCEKCSSEYLKEYKREQNKRENNKKQEDSGEVKKTERPQPPNFSPQNLSPIRQGFYGPIVFDFQITTTDATTPDWNRLCAQFCRNGSGGLLCNCDLPPL